MARVLLFNISTATGNEFAVRIYRELSDMCENREEASVNPSIDSTPSLILYRHRNYEIKVLVRTVQMGANQIT